MTTLLLSAALLISSSSEAVSSQCNCNDEYDFFYNPECASERDRMTRQFSNIHIHGDLYQLERFLDKMEDDATYDQLQYIEEMRWIIISLRDQIS